MNNDIKNYLKTCSIDDLQEFINEAQSIKTKLFESEKKELKSEILDLLEELKNFCGDIYMYFPTEFEDSCGEMCDAELTVHVIDIIKMVESLWGILPLILFRLLKSKYDLTFKYK